MMYNHLDKERNLLQLNNYIYAKTLAMFDYTGLPETIPAIELEKILQQKGYGFITEVEGELYVLTGSYSGKQDAYGNYTQIRIDNPFLKFSKDLDLKTDGVIIQNDDMANGLEPLINRINSLMVETEISMYIDNYNSRIQTLLSAGDAITQESAEKYLEKVKKGDLGVIGESQIFDGIKVQNNKQATQNGTTQLIELTQYLRANLYNELGLNANYNMKRERLNSSEVGMNDDALHPFIDNMFDSRKKAIAKVNEKYGLSIGVEFGSIWERKKSDEMPPETEEKEVSESPETNVSSGVTIEQLVLNLTPSEIKVEENQVEDEREDLEDITQTEIDEEIEIQEEKEVEEDDVQ